MASLQNQSINSTYEGLLKSNNNAALPTSGAVTVTDGAGNVTPLALSQTQAQINTGATGSTSISGDNIQVTDSAVATGFAISAGQMDFAGSVDFSGATVTGLPGGAAGLENGTGASSLQSAAALTTTPANAAGTNSIALGNGADALQAGGIAIGDNTITNGTANGIAIGKDANGNWGQQIAIGQSAKTNAVGAGAVMAIGAFSQANANESVALGYLANVYSGAWNSTAIGSASKARVANTTALGRGADATVSGSVALGAGVVADKVDTVSMKALDLQTASTPTAGGIIMTDAGSTERRINIDASGNLLIDSTPVGGLTSYTMTTPVVIPATATDTVVYSFVIPGGTFGAGDVLLFKSLCGSQSGSNGFQFWIGASAGVYTTDPLAVASTSNPSLGFEKSIYIESSTSSRWYDENYPNEVNGGNFSLYNSTVNWANDVYINFQGYSDPGNVAYFYGASLTKIN